MYLWLRVANYSQKKNSNCFLKHQHVDLCDENTVCSLLDTN